MIDGQPWYVVAVTPPFQRNGDSNEQPQPDLHVTKELLEEVGREILGLYDKKIVKSQGT